MANIVLIHGAWHGGWCWAKVVDLLAGRGHSVIAPDMPGHGQDTTPRAELTLEDYCRRITGVLSDFTEPAVLVGHSMGGMLISAAAEAAPDKVGKLVYLTAFVPRDGDAGLAMSAEINNTSELGDHLIPTEDGTALVVADEILERVFYHDCSADDIALARSKLTPQAVGPMNSVIELHDARFGRIAKAYIECVQDAAITLDAQRQMARRGGISEVATLDTSHSPFFSAPVALADAIESLI